MLLSVLKSHVCVRGFAHAHIYVYFNFNIHIQLNLLELLAALTHSLSKFLTHKFQARFWQRLFICNCFNFPLLSMWIPQGQLWFLLNSWKNNRRPICFMHYHFKGMRILNGNVKSPIFNFTYNLYST